MDVFGLLRRFSLRITNCEFAIRNSEPLAIRRGARKRGGFSLVEAVVYIAILAILSAIAVNTLLVVHSSLGTLKRTRTISATAAVAMERMARTIRDARAVDAAASVLNASPGTLVIIGGEDPALSHRFDLSGGALSYRRGTDPAMALTPPGVAVGNLVFRATSTAVSEAVRVELTLAAADGRATTTQSFYVTVVLRNSYAP